MNLTIAYMIQATVSYRFEQIGAIYVKRGFGAEKGSKHIMDNVARQVIIMQEHRGQPVHLRVMCFEKQLYIGSFYHTLIRHTHSEKLNPTEEKFFNKRGEAATRFRF